MDNMHHLRNKANILLFLRMFQLYVILTKIKNTHTFKRKTSFREAISSMEIVTVMSCDKNILEIKHWFDETLTIRKSVNRP